jgi:hypothetical protein
MSKLVKTNASLFLLLLIGHLPNLTLGMKDSAYKANRPYPKNFIAVGFSDRLMQVSKERFQIQYFNQGKTVNDSFYYNDPIKSNSNLVNFVLTGGLSNRYVGAKLDLGFVPFANRNSHQSLSAFALIPIGKNVLLSPFLGVSRLRKQKKIGNLTGKDDIIYFKDVEFEEVSIRVHQAIGSYQYGLGIYVNLEEDIFLHLECKYHQNYKVRNRLKITGYKTDSDESFLASLFADKWEHYSESDPHVLFRNSQNKPIQQFFDLGNLAFSAQIVFTINSSGGNGYHPKKFMGTQ